MNCAADPIDSDGPSQVPLSGLRFETEDIAIDVGYAIADGKPDKAQAEALRERIRHALDRAPVCGVEQVRTLCCIALRSEYFLDSVVSGVRKPGRKKAGDPYGPNFGTNCARHQGPGSRSRRGV